MARPRIRPWVRYGVSAAVLIGLLTLIPIRELGRALAQAPPSVLFTTLIVLLAGHVVAALKWRLLHGGQAGLSVETALRAHFLGVLANLWLPGVVGGDLVRAGVTFGRVSRPALVVVASVVDRIVDSLGLLLLAAAGLVLIGGAQRNAWHLVEAGVLVALMAGVVLFSAFRFLKARPSPKFAAVIEAIELMARRPGLVAAALAISTCVQAAFIMVNVNLGRAVGMAAPVSAWFMAWPLAKLAALIPISAAGLGVREAALVVLMRPFGDPPGAVMAAGLLWQAVFITGGLLGWGVSMFFSGDTGLRHKPTQSSIE
jgi:uncharacterized membrane protein YbhN (UPF0104 family)